MFAWDVSNIFPFLLHLWLDYEMEYKDGDEDDSQCVWDNTE